MLKLIKNGAGNYVSDNELKNASGISHIYIPGGKMPDAFGSFPQAEIISDESVFFSKEHGTFAELVKGEFNPLLKVQNTLFITKGGNIAYEAPQLYSWVLENEKAIDELIQAAFDKALMESLIGYCLTKDLLFMNILAKKSFDPSAFRLCQGFIERPEDKEIAAELISALGRGGYENAVLMERERREGELKQRIREAVRSGQTQRNVIFIHLESISQLIFNANKHLMPTINGIFEKSVNFSRYYSSATSTLMAVSAIFHGNDFELDRFKSYEEILLDSCHSENIFTILRKNGYETKPFIYSNPSLTNEFYEANIYDDGETANSRIFDYDEFISAMESFIESNKNGKFAAFVDYEPTHCGTTDKETAKIPIFEQKSKYAYMALDKAIQRLWSCLDKNGLLEKTTVVLYGDHGDDKWTRCINNGFSHLTEPYLTSIHCPLAIYDSRLDYGYLSGNISSIDIKPSVLYMLGIENPDSFPYSGINIFEGENHCVYSASLLANQYETEKIGSFEMSKLNGFCTVETKNKSFCAINENYCIIAGKDGVQMFNIHSDPFSYNNLLNFYELDKEGSAFKFDNYKAWRGHFRLEIMADAQVYECLQNFYSLRSSLRKRIEAKNGYVKDIENPFNFDGLRKVRDRGFII